MIIHAKYDRWVREVHRQEERRRMAAEGAIHLPNGAIGLTTDNDDLLLINQLEKLATRITSRNESPVRVQVRAEDGYLLTQLGNELATTYSDWSSEFEARQGGHIFHPRIALMMRVGHQWGGDIQRCLSELSDGLSCQYGETLLRAVEFIRNEYNSESFKRSVSNSEALATKNFRSACAYLVSLFERVSRLLMVRVDLYYRPEMKSFFDRVAAAAAFERYLRTLRESRIVPDVRGWMCRCEEGPKRGVHFHVLVAMDGHKRKDAYSAGVKLGSHWVDQCAAAGNAGSYFNCYDRKDEYRFNGLGLVSIRDWRKLVGVCEAVRYVTKAKYQIRPGLGITKNFRKGQTKVLASKRGAPRKSHHDLSLVRSIFDLV